MLGFIKGLFKSESDTINEIFINRNSILHNFSLIQKKAWNKKLIPVLKSNAYWHGIAQICEILNDTDCDIIAVDSFPEYQIVRDSTDKSIMLLWELPHSVYKELDFSRVILTIWNIDTLKFLISLNSRLQIQIFLNTGMNREWIQEKDLSIFCEILSQANFLNLYWVMSHLAQWDSIGAEFNNIQVEKFKAMNKTILDFGFTPEIRHLEATAWIISVNNEYFNAARIGLWLYWLSPFADQQSDPYSELEQAISVFSTITAIQEVSSWDFVSYWESWKVESPTKIASVWYWYFEWLPRDYSWNLIFYLKDQEFNQIGKICMNYSSLNIWEYELKIWDRIEIISSEKSKKNNLTQISLNSWISVYELLVRINWWLRRTIS